MGLRSIEVKCKIILIFYKRAIYTFNHLSSIGIDNSFFDIYSYADGPKMVVHPKTTSGDKMSAVMLYCKVESNPPPTYYWTKGNSREVNIVI